MLNFKLIYIKNLPLNKLAVYFFLIAHCLQSMVQRLPYIGILVSRPCAPPYLSMHTCLTSYRHFRKGHTYVITKLAAEENNDIVPMLPRNYRKLPEIFLLLFSKIQTTMRNASQKPLIRCRAMLESPCLSV